MHLFFLKDRPLCNVCVPMNASEHGPPHTGGKRDISSVSLRQGLTTWRICQVRSMCFQGFSCLRRHRRSTERNLSPHAYEASTLCPSHLPGWNLPFFSITQHECGGQRTIYWSQFSPNNHVNLRDQAQILSGLAANNFTQLACPKFCLFYINHFCLD